jgi:hypothetical protein
MNVNSVCEPRQLLTTCLTMYLPNTYPVLFESVMDANIWANHNQAVALRRRFVDGVLIQREIERKKLKRMGKRSDAEVHECKKRAIEAVKMAKVELRSYARDQKIRQDARPVDAKPSPTSPRT